MSDNVIEFRPYEPLCVMTKRPIKTEQYRIFVNGRAVGFLPWHKNARPLLTSRVDPMLQEEIEAEAAKVPIPGGGKRDLQPAAMPSEVVDIEEEGLAEDDFE